MWNPYNYQYEPDLAEEAAGHELPSTVSHHSGSVYSQSTGSLSVAMQNMQAGTGAAQVIPAHATPTPNLARLCLTLLVTSTHVNG
jgi:hypothetical protein